MEYDPKLVALILNFSERIIEIEPSNVNLFNQRLMKALECSGYLGITLEEAHHHIDRFMITDSDHDLVSLPEYAMELPLVSEGEMA